MAVATPVVVARYVSAANVSTSDAVAITGTIPAGSVVYATVHGGGTTDPGFSGLGLTWTATDKVEATAAPLSTSQLYWAYTADPITTGTVTATRSGSGGLSFTLAHAAGASGAVGVTVPQTGSTVSITIPGIATADGALVVGAVTGRAVAIYTAVSPTVILDTTPQTGGTSSRAGASLYRATTTGTSTSLAITQDSGIPWAGVALAILPAPVAAPVTGDYEVVIREAGTTTRLETIQRSGGTTHPVELIGWTPPTDPTPTDGPLIGIYNGPISTTADPIQKTITDFGVTPAVTVQYVVQPENFNLATQGGIIRRDLFRSILDRGCSLYITLASKDGHQYSHNDFAAQVPGAITVMDQWIAFSSSLRAYAANLGLQFWTGWESEFEVKVNHGEITGVSNQTFAQSHDIFCQRAKAHDPLLKTVYHVGHFDASNILAIMSAKQVGFDLFGLDPYRGNGSSQTTYTQMINSKNLHPGNLRTNPDFIRLAAQNGGTNIGLTESGTHVPGYTDTNLATFINSIPAAVTGLTLGDMVIWFNRGSGPNNDSDLITSRSGTPQNKPLAVAALAALMDKNNQ